MAGDYENSWHPTNDPEGLKHIRAIFSKWCPPNKELTNILPCWQDGPDESPPYPYGTYRTSGVTGRDCPWRKPGPDKHHFAPETSNLFEDYFSDDGSHWCHDGNVTLTQLGVLKYLNKEMWADVKELPIFHIVVNTHDWRGGEISLDLAFPTNSYYSKNLSWPRSDFEDDTLFIREYRKGKMRGNADKRNYYGDDCKYCWQSDSLSMRVYSKTSNPNKYGDIVRDSNGRRKVGQPISKRDIESATKKGFRFIDYEFSVKYAGSGGKLRIAFPIGIMAEIIGAKWNSSPLRIFPPLG